MNTDLYFYAENIKNKQSNNVLGKGNLEEKWKRKDTFFLSSLYN